MAARPIPLFVNPAAARGRAAQRLGAVTATFERLGLDCSVHSSRAPGDIERGVSDAVAAGRGRVIVAGGDGSVHEAVNGLVAAGGDAALGVVPTGTGNDFAKAAAIPLHPEDAAELLADRIENETPSRRIDLGRMNARYFVNGAGIGFDARVARIASGMRLPLGDFVYLLAVLRALVAGVVTPSLTLEFDGETRHGPLTLAHFANGPWVGAQFYIAPMAHNDDGALDLVYADPLSRRRILELLPRLLEGRHIGQPGVHHARIERCRIRAPAALPSHADGETQAPAARFDIELLPAALRLI